MIYSACQDNTCQRKDTCLRFKLFMDGQHPTNIESACGNGSDFNFYKETKS